MAEGAGPPHPTCLHTPARGLEQRGEATVPGSQNQLEFEPGWSCLTCSSQDASPLPRHSPQGAQAGHRGPRPCAGRGATSPQGAGMTVAPVPTQGGRATPTHQPIQTCFRLATGSLGQASRGNQGRGRVQPLWVGSSLAHLAPQPS